MNRHLRSHLDLLYPNLSAQVKRKRQQQKDHHDQHSQSRDLNEGGKVYVKDFPEGKTWLPGTIAKKEGKVTYHVLLEDGRIVRRHIDHIRSRTDDSTVEIDLPQGSGDEDAVLLDMTSAVAPGQQTDNNNRNESSAQNSLPESSNVELRRSNRTRHSPVRYRSNSWTT